MSAIYCKMMYVFHSHWWQRCTFSIKIQLFWQPIKLWRRENRTFAVIYRNKICQKLRMMTCVVSNHIGVPNKCGTQTRTMCILYLLLNRARRMWFKLSFECFYLNYLVASALDVNTMRLKILFHATSQINRIIQIHEKKILIFLSF